MQNDDTFLSGLTTSNLLNQRRFKDLYFSVQNNGSDENLTPFGNNDQTIIQYVNLSPYCIELLDSFKTNCDVYLVGLITAVLNTTKLDSAHVNTINSRVNLATSLSKHYKEFNKLLSDAISDISFAKQVYRLIHSISLLLKGKNINNFIQKINIKTSLGSDAKSEEISEWVDFVGKISLLYPSLLIANSSIRNIFLTKLPNVISQSQLVILLTDILYNLETLTTSSITIFETLLKHLDNIYTFEEKIEIFNHCKSNTIDQHSIYKTIYILNKGLIKFRDNLITSIDNSSILHHSLLIYTLNQLKDDDFYEYCKIILTRIIVSKGIGWSLFCHLIDYILCFNTKSNDILEKQICTLLEKYSFSHYLLSPYNNTKFATLKAIKAILKRYGNCKLIPDIKTLINSKNLTCISKCSESDDEEFITNLNVKNNSKDDLSDVTCAKIFKSEITNKTMLLEWLETLELYAIYVGLDQIDYVKITSTNLINGLEIPHSKCLFICYLSELGFTIKIDDLSVITPNDFFRGDPNIGHSIVQLVERYWLADICNQIYPYILSHIFYASGLIDLTTCTYWLTSLQSFYKNCNVQGGKIYPLSDLFFLGATRPLESIVGVEFDSDRSSKVLTGLKCIECNNNATNSNNTTLLEQLVIRIIWHLLSSHNSSCNCHISDQICNHEFNYASIRCPLCDCYSNLLILGNRFNLTLLKSRTYGVMLLINIMNLDIPFKGLAKDLWTCVCNSVSGPRNYPVNENITVNLPITDDTLPMAMDSIDTVTRVEIPTHIVALYNDIANLDVYNIDPGRISSLGDMYITDEWKTLVEFAKSNYTCDKSSAMDMVLSKVILLSSLVYLPNNNYNDVWTEWPAWPLHLPDIPGLLDIRADWLLLDQDKLNLTMDNLYFQNENLTDLSLYDLNILVPWYVGKLYWARLINLTHEYQVDNVDYITSKLNLSCLGSSDWYYKFALGPLRILLASTSTNTKFSSLSLQGVLIYYELLKKQHELKNQLFAGLPQLMILLDYFFRLLNSGTKINSLYTIYLCECLPKVIHGTDILFPIISTLLLSKRTPNFDTLSFFYPLWYHPKAIKQCRFFFLRILSSALNATDRDLVKSIISKLHIVELLHSFSIVYDHFDPQIHQSINTIVSRSYR